MKQVFASELDQFSWQFKDYILQKYGIELTLNPVREHRANLPMLGVFLDENHPQFETICQEGRNYNPFSSEFLDASWEVGQTLKTEKKSHPFVEAQKFLKILDYLPNGLFIRQIPWTIFITLLCSLIGIITILGGEDWVFSHFNYPLFDGEKQEYWRYVSHSVVHLSLSHFAFNLSFWWIFGGAIERLHGSIALIVLTLLSSVLTGIVQNYATPNELFFGLSGVVYGVLGFVLIVDKFSNKSYDLPQGFFTMIIAGILFGFISPFFGIMIGNEAHISGLLSGVFFGLIFVKR